MTAPSFRFDVAEAAGRLQGDVVDDDQGVAEPEPWGAEHYRYGLVQLAIVSGQPLTGPGGLESWHPRDIATLRQHYEDQASEARMADARRAYAAQQG